MKILILISLLLVLSGCSETFKPDLCSSVNFNLLSCEPTDRSKPQYDLKTDDPKFIGYVCISPEDFTTLKKMSRKIIENLD